jgi:2',3'-cyclic-nucleotide 2'-phosphodiesterase (5'-nucleotidase family)
MIIFYQRFHLAFKINLKNKQMKQLFWVLLSSFLLSACARTFHLANVQTRSYRIEKASYPVDPKIAAMIEPYKETLSKTMDEVIGYCDEDLVKGKPTSTLTNWFADVLLAESQKLVTLKVDFAIQNYGGIRIPVFSKGNITVGKIYELMPFDNILYILELKGSTVKTLLTKIAESGGWPVSYTISMSIAYGKALNILINNEPLDESRVYNVAIPDYLANGGDNLDFLRDQVRHNTGALIRDMLINNVRELKAAGKTVKAINDSRIKD